MYQDFLHTGAVSFFLSFFFFNAPGPQTSWVCHCMLPVNLFHIQWTTFPVFWYSYPNLCERCCWHQIHKWPFTTINDVEWMKHYKTNCLWTIFNWVTVDDLLCFTTFLELGLEVFTLHYIHLDGVVVQKGAFKFHMSKRYMSSLSCSGNETQTKRVEQRQYSCLNLFFVSLLFHKWEVNGILLSNCHVYCMLNGAAHVFTAPRVWKTRPLHSLSVSKSQECSPSAMDTLYAAKHMHGRLWNACVAYAALKEHEHTT